jgi:signal transduction histidine kinase
MTAAPVRARRIAGGWPLGRIFTVLAATAALVTVVAVALGTAALMRLDDARTNLLDVVAPAALGAEDLTAALLNQETGARGFALTGRASARAPYDEGLAQQEDAENTVRAMAARGGFPGVADDLNALDAAVHAWRVGYAEPVLAGRMTSSPDAGRDLFDRVRGPLNRLETDLDAQRTAGRARLSAASSYLTVVGVAATLLVAAFLVTTAVGLRRLVLRPVSDLAGQVREVVDGRFDRTVVASGPREILQLGSDVDAMRVRILSDLESSQESNRLLDAQTQELERSNRDLEQFAYVASHDLQEPLRKVSSFCQLLQRRYAGRLDERADQYSAFATDGAARMQQLINDLLSFSRVGRTTAGFTEVKLDEVLAGVATQLDEARADLDGRIDVGPLPAVTGDPALLRQLFLNLVGNGLKFHREGVPPVVTVAATTDPATDPTATDPTADDPSDGAQADEAGDRAADPTGRADGLVEITVTDNGIGIEPEYADKVFVIFQRLHARDVYEGTGIGLALAKKIVEFHGGHIALDPPGGAPGATVRLTLPLPERTP